MWAHLLSNHVCGTLLLLAGKAMGPMANHIQRSLYGRQVIKETVK
jgi:hypothetical protein